MKVWQGFVSSIYLFCIERTSIDKVISVPPINPQLSQAINLLQRLDSELEKSPQSKGKSTQRKARPFSVIESQLQQNATTFKVECGPYFSSPTEFVCKADKVLDTFSI